MVHQIKRKMSDRSLGKKGTRKARPQPTTSTVVFAPEKFADSSKVQQSNPICFPFGRGDQQQEDHQQHSSVPKSVRLAATIILYALLFGAVIRTFVYQFQINNLSAEMLDAASTHKANLERLESVQQKMADLHTSFAELKEMNDGLKEQKDMSDFMEQHHQKKQQEYHGTSRES